METNPYRIEEQLWTPAPVYDVHPPNTLDYSSFDFLQGSDGYDEGKVKNSLWEGFKKFFEDAFGTLGQIVGGAIEFGVGVFRAFAEGVTKLLGFIGKAVGDIFKGPKVTPLPPIFNPIKTNLEEALEPYLDKIENASTTINNSVAKQEDLNAQIKALEVRMSNNFDKLEENNQEYTQIKEEFDALSVVAAQQESELKRINEETRKAVQSAQTVTNQFTTFQDKNKREIDQVRQSANTAISKAENATTSLNAYKIAQEQLLSQLTQKAQKGVDDAKKAQEAIADANQKFSTNVEKVIASDEGLKKARAEATKAVQAIENLVDIGGSLVPLVAGTTTPSWTTMKTVTNTGKTYNDLPIYSGPNEQITEWPEHRVVKVSPGTLYQVSFWERADAPGTQLFVEMRNNITGQHVIQKSSQKTSDGSLISERYVLGGFEFHTKWTKQEWVIRFEDDVREVYLAGFYWNHPNGTATAKQYIAGFEIAPYVPAKELLDKLGNDIKEANLTLEKKIEEGVKANQDVKDAKANAASATANVDKLNKAMQTSVDIGASLVAVIPGTTIPDWSRCATVGPGEGRPSAPVSYPGQGVEAWGCAPGDPYPSVMKDAREVKVASGVTYEYSFYAWTDVANSSFLIRLVSKELGSFAIESQSFQEKEVNGKTVKDTSKYVATNWGINGRTVIPSAKVWTEYKGTFEVRPGTEYVKIDRVEWHHVDPKNGHILLADLKISPQIPDQAVIDRLQNEAILKNAKVGNTNATAIDVLQKTWDAQVVVNQNQKTWNDTAANLITLQGEAIKKNERVAGTNANAITILKEAFETQKVINNKQEDWNKGAETAIAANTAALAALARSDAGINVIPIMPGKTTPVWAENSDWSGINDSVYEGFRWHRFGETKGATAWNKVAVDPELEYDFTVWLHGTNGSMLFIELRDQDGNHAVASGGIGAYKRVRRFSSGGYVGEVTQGASAYLVSGCALLNGWTKLTTRVKLRPGVRYVQVGSIYGNHPNGPSGEAFIGEDMILSPHVPSQKQVDDAQNEALKSLSRTVHLLNRPERGASILAYKPPKDSDLENPKANPDWDVPEWTDLAEWRRDMATAGSGDRSFMSGMPYETMWGVSSSTGTKDASGGWMNVEAGQLYKLSYWHRATAANTRYYFQMFGDGTGNTGSPLRVVSGKTEDGDLTFGGATSYIVSNDVMSYGKWKFNEVIVKIEPNISRLRFARIYWNHPNGTATANQWIAGLDFAVNVPSQQQVDEAQTKAIAGLQKFQDQSTTLATIQGNMINKNHKLANTNRTAIQVLEDSVKGLEDFRIAQIKWNDEQKNINKSVSSAFDSIEELQRKQAEYIVRVMHRPAGQAFYDDYISVSAGGTVTAKNAWGGEAIIDMTREAVVNVSSGDGYVNVDKRSIKQVHVGTQRTLLAGSWDTKNADMIINYWVYQGTPQSKTVNCPTGYITGSSYRSSSWTEVGSVTVPPTNGSTTIQWKIKLTAADRECVYGMRIKIDGVANSSNQATWEGIGPLGPLGDGNYEMNRIFSLPLSETKSQTLTFETYFRPGSGDGSSQAKASLNSAKVMYIKSNG